MTSTLKDQITEDMKNAMRSKDKDRLGTIRLILAALKQREVDERITLTNEDVLVILNKMIKQRRDSVSQYEAGNRPDLAAIEKTEIDVILSYLPQQMSEAEITVAVQQAIKSTGAAGAKDMGKVMGALKTDLQGKADMGLVSKAVKSLLQ